MQYISNLIYFPILLLLACGTASTATFDVLDPIAATPSPLYVSEDYGATWQVPAHNLPDNVQASFLAKLGEQILLASDNAGLFISNKDKTDWTQIGTNLPTKKINALHVSGARIFVGLYEKGIYESKDKGRTWQSINYNLSDLQVRAILQTDTQMFAGTDTGLLLLDQETKKWKKIVEQVQINTLNIDHNQLITGTNKGVLYSKDKGENWTWISQEGAAHNTAILNGKVLVMHISDALFISDNWGKNWLDVYYTPKQASYIYDATQIDRFLLMSNNYGVHRSVDSGISWEFIYPMEKVVIFDLLVDKRLVYACTRHKN